MLILSPNVASESSRCALKRTHRPTVVLLMNALNAQGRKYTAGLTRISQREHVTKKCQPKLSFGRVSNLRHS